MDIYGAKFQEHAFNISRDIVYSCSFYQFSVAVLWHHQWSNLRNWKTYVSISKRKKRDFKRKNSILPCILKGLSNKKKSFFYVIYTLNPPALKLSLTQSGQEKISGRTMNTGNRQLLVCRQTLRWYNTFLESKKLYLKIQRKNRVLYSRVPRSLHPHEPASSHS